MQQDRANILIIDDTVANLRVIAGMLKERGYKTRPVTDGRTALQAARNDPPDLILLDITMPEMDGYEVCRQLKADPQLADIPVIFISALNETMDKVKAFACGGVDYVSKPLQFEEVAARVEAHLELRRQKRQLQDSYDELKKLESLRDNLIHMIVHDMRSPLTASIMSLDFVSMVAPDLPSEAAEHLAKAKELNGMIAEMINQLLDISRIEAGQMPLKKAKVDIVSIARNAIGALSALAETRKVNLIAPEPVILSCDAAIIGRVLTNLLGNALKFTEAQGQIEVVAAQEGTGVRISVTDNGPGIPIQYHQKIFDKFSQVDGQKRKFGTGLGLAFCRLAIEAHGGSIGVVSQPGNGSTFWFTLPG